MKKLILLFVFAVVLWGVNISYAQLSETTMKDIIETAQDKVKSLENTEDMEVVNITMDLLVGKKGEKYVYRYLDNSFDYKIYAVGDRRISKLNVEVRKKGTDATTVTLVDLAEILEKGRLQKDPVLEPDDVIIVPERLINF